MKPKHQRLVFIAVSMVFLCAAGLLTLNAFRENIVYFYSPSELLAAAPAPNAFVRLGGLVESGSIARAEDDALTFTLEDGAAKMRVSYKGMLPNLFREGQGIVAEGYLLEDGSFKAQTILAKHDENYMPRELVGSLKKSGYWKMGEPQP